MSHCQFCPLSSWNYQVLSSATFLLSSCETLDQFSCFLQWIFKCEYFLFSCFFSGFFFLILFQPYMYLWWRFLICCSVCSSWKLSWDRNVFMRVSRGIKDRFGCGQEAHWGNSRGNSIIWNWDSISSWKKPHEDLVEVLIRKWPGHFPRQKIFLMQNLTITIKESKFLVEKASWAAH